MSELDLDAIEARWRKWLSQYPDMGLNENEIGSDELRDVLALVDALRRATAANAATTAYQQLEARRQMLVKSNALLEAKAQRAVAMLRAAHLLADEDEPPVVGGGAEPGA